MQHHHEPKSRINEWVKFILMQTNFFFAMFGMTLVGMSIYVLVANWGDLDPAFFTGSAVALLLFGLIVTAVTYIGCLGVVNQRRKSPYTEWQGMRLLVIYQVFLTLALVAEIYWLAYSLDSVNGLRSSALLYDAKKPLPYQGLETTIATKFNAFFFAAQLSPFCPDLKYTWFWTFVDGYCNNPNMMQINCLKCNDYSVTACDADAQTCYKGGATYQIAACPYNACRKGILTFIYNTLAPFSYFVVAYTIFHLLLLVLNCLLMCYNPRDTDEKIRAKNGIFTAARAPHLSAQTAHRQPSPRHQASAGGGGGGRGSSSADWHEAGRV